MSAFLFDGSVVRLLFRRGFTQYANIANSGLRGQSEHSLASVVQALGPVSLLKFHETCAGFEALLNLLAAIKEILYGFSNTASCAGCPNCEFIGIVAKIFSVCFGHVLGLDDGIALRLV